MSSIGTSRARIQGSWRRALVATLATLVAGIGAIVGAAPSGASYPTFEGSFETPTVVPSYDTYYAGTSFGQWDVTAGSVDHGRGPAGTQCVTSTTQCVDLSGDGPGAIAQTWDTREGSNCQVSFWMSHHNQLPQGATLTASINGNDVGTFSHTAPVTSTAPQWQQRLFSFIATGPTTTLGFRSNTTWAAGPQIDNVTVECKPTGILKVCKVAGPTVPLGQPFTFKANNGAPFTVPAGPAPGGYCTVAGRFGLGLNVTVAEAASSGTWVTSIDVLPASQLVGTPNLSARTVVAKIGNGVTEVTFTNTSVKTGYLEVCKQLRGDVPGTGPRYHFDVPGVPGGVDVPAGACSPALQVPAGKITVHEQLTSGSTLVDCSTIPSTSLLGCDQNTGNADIVVTSGGLSSQTILTFVNAPRET